MSYRIAICDDQPDAAHAVQQLAQQWAQTRDCGVQTVCFSSAEAFLFHYADQRDYDILLLDIEMAGMNGVEMARRVRSGNKEIQIIFITGYMDYIADGYEVEALHYLVKPVNRDKLFAALDRAVVKLGRNDHALTLDFGGETLRVPLYEIRYLEVQRNYVTVHAQQLYTVKTSLSALMAGLGEEFIKVGRSYVINLRYVQRVTRTDVYMLNGGVIPLPRGMYDAVHRAIIERT